jgi:hypothetical protein
VESILDAPSLLTICAIAFISVFLLLSFLAVAFRIITQAFPVPRRVLDSALVAAIGAAVAVALPGARITNIEEER